MYTKFLLASLLIHVINGYVPQIPLPELLQLPNLTRNFTRNVTTGEVISVKGSYQYSISVKNKQDPKVLNASSSTSISTPTAEPTAKLHITLPEFKPTDLQGDSIFFHTDAAVNKPAHDHVDASLPRQKNILDALRRPAHDHVNFLSSSSDESDIGGGAPLSLTRRPLPFAGFKASLKRVPMKRQMAFDDPNAGRPAPVAKTAPKVAEVSINSGLLNQLVTRIFDLMGKNNANSLF